MDYRLLGKLNHDALKGLSYDECSLLAAEMRHEMVNVVTKNGGHLASNLGIVELTIALHRVFDCPKDRFIFDVSHQCYVHKLLTDRYDRFDTLRKPGGLSGFQKRSESDCDPFGGGHASTSLSAALGFAEADRILKRDNYTVAIAGDGAFTGGMMHEAMNNCHDGLRLIFILNENEMSISPNIGRFAEYIADIRAKESYFDTKRAINRALSSIPGIGKGLVRFVRRQKNRVKNLLYSSNYFEKLGFRYLGPVDGHDIKKLETLLTEAKEHDRPVILHVKTKKGHGYSPAETDPGKFHGISGANSKKTESFSAHFGNTLCSLAETDPKICAITAAMRDGTGLVPFSEKFPDRFFDVGIAEEHAITFAAGLSAAGMHTVFAVYSTFLQRSYDQLIHDVSLQNLPITIAVDRAGIALNDGPTHHGIYDVSMALSIPGSTIWAPLDFESLDRILPRAIAAKGCHFVRYRSGEAFYDTEHVLAYVDSELFLRATDDTNAGGVIITYGHITTQALKAREAAKQRGISLKVIVPEKLSTDEAFINTLCHLIPPGATKICFLEEGIENGGYGMALHALSEKCRLPYEILAIKDGGISFRENESPYKTLGISHEDVLRVFGI